MAAFGSRKEVALNGWIRENSPCDIPNEIILLILLFFQNPVITWSVEDNTKFKEIFKRGFNVNLWNNLHWTNYVKTIFSKTFTLNEYDFYLFVEITFHDIICSLQLKTEMADIINYIKIGCNLQSNINIKQFKSKELHFRNLGYTFNRDIFKLAAKDNQTYKIIQGYDKLEMKFDFEILEIKQFEIMVKDTLNWTLNYNLLHSSKMRKKYNHWILEINDDRLMFKVICSLPRVVTKVKIRYNLELISGSQFIEAEGYLFVYDNFNGEIYNLSDVRFDNRRIEKIVFKIEIIKIFAIYGQVRYTLRRDEWADWGFI